MCSVDETRIESDCTAAQSSEKFGGQREDSVMKTYLNTALGAFVLLLLVVGCDRGPKSARGFRLPDGNIQAGETTFVALNCNACHKVAGVKLPPPPKEPEVTVTLGGKVSRVKTYGELVTAIINPSHTLAKGYPKEKIATTGTSKMTNFNDTMTVAQLTNLVAFLQSHYEIKVDDTMYSPY